MAQRPLQFEANFSLGFKSESVGEFELRKYSHGLRKEIFVLLYLKK